MPSASALSGMKCGTSCSDKEKAVGQTIMIGGYPYLVIGELIPKDQNSNYSGPDKSKIFIPFYAMSPGFPLAERRCTARTNSPT